MEKIIWMIRSPSKGGLKMVNFERAFFSWFAVFLILFLNFKTPVKYLEKQTELNYLCLYIKKYARIKKT